MFSPRYKRNKSPSDAGHGVKQSVAVDELSDHAFGSALDIIFWGGHFSALS
jgi:hypothetical protein